MGFTLGGLPISLLGIMEGILFGVKGSRKFLVGFHFISLVGPILRKFGWLQIFGVLVKTLLCLK